MGAPGRRGHPGGRHTRLPFTSRIRFFRSALDAPGRPFFDPGADAALFDELEGSIEFDPRRIVRREPYHINSSSFAEALVRAFQTAWQEARAGA